MPNLILADLGREISANVEIALREDLGSGDITAQLIAADRSAAARIPGGLPAMIAAFTAPAEAPTRICGTDALSSSNAA